MFFQRILFDHTNLQVKRSVVENEISSMCEKFGMESQLVSAYILFVICTFQAESNYLVHLIFALC